MKETNPGALGGGGQIVEADETYIGRTDSARKRPKKSKGGRPSASARYPRHSVKKALRIPRAILDQNAGKPCMVKQAAEFLGMKATGPFRVEVSSATKYRFLERLSS